MNDPVNYVDLWGLCGSDGVVFKQYIPTQGIEEKISVLHESDIKDQLADIFDYVINKNIFF